MTMTPALERRRSDSAHTAALHSGGSDDAGTSKRKCAADDTLLTFCPPAPWARIIVNSISRSSRKRLSCIGSIASAIVARPGGRRVRCEIGRASCRESVCQYVESSVGGGTLKKKKKRKKN